jgi:hypothetical protein
MGIIIMRITLVLGIMAGLAILTWVCIYIFGGIIKEMKDDGRPKIADGTKEWEEIKKRLRIEDNQPFDKLTALSNGEGQSTIENRQWRNR